MLEEMNASHFAEWLAFKKLEREAEDEAAKRSALAAKAEAGMTNYKRKGR